MSRVPWLIMITISDKKERILGKLGLSPSPSDDVLSWLRLQTHLECIPHPFHMYTKYFSNLLCCGWACMCALTMLGLGRSGVEFRKIGAQWSPSDVVMSQLRLQTNLECIPHPCHMYTQRFSTLICWGWAYNPPLHCYTCADQEWSLGKLGWAQPKWCCNVMLEAPNPLGVHPTSMPYVCAVFQHFDMLWMGIWIHPYTVTPVHVRGGF